MRSIIILGMLMLAFPAILAHLEGGQDVTKEGMILDFGHSPKELQSDSQIAFAINLVNESTQEPIKADEAWVRMTHGKSTAFAGTFSVERGSVSFTYEFPKADIYEMTVSYRDQGAMIAEHTYTLEVKQSPMYLAMIGGVTAVIGGLGLLLARRRWRARKKQ